MLDPPLVIHSFKFKTLFKLGTFNVFELENDAFIQKAKNKRTSWTDIKNSNLNSEIPKENSFFLF